MRLDECERGDLATTLDLESLVDRHARHWVLPQLGEAGVTAFARSHVFVAGAGGLGSPLLQYLAGAGVGQITVADGDTVSRSNLERQTLYDEADCNESKAKRAAAHLIALNKDIRIEAVPTFLDSENVTEFISGADVVVDALDRIGAKMMLHDAALTAGIPLIYGSALAWEGQVSTILPGKSACLRCFFGDISMSPSSEVETCANMGVFAPLCGMIGTLMAGETLKLLSTLQSSPQDSSSLTLLTDKLTQIDLRTNRTHTLDASRPCAWCKTL